jgi:hypothetical protein
MWKKIVISTKSIEHETEKAILVHCPADTAYEQYLFWHPLKLVKKGPKSGTRELSFSDDFVFKLARYKEEDGKRVIASQKELNAREIIALYDLND